MTQWPFNGKVDVYDLLMRVMQQISTSIQQNIFTLAKNLKTNELTQFWDNPLCFIGYSDRPWCLKAFPAMLGCGQPGTLLMNIKQEVIFCLCKWASQIQGWRGFMNSALLGTISSLCVCWLSVLCHSFECLCFEIVCASFMCQLLETLFAWMRVGI